ncbi:MAG: hypothetical protein IJD70_07150 [Clostridia bacterium]|nr:hypothetical protein [Clostridia bacterium]
MKKITALTLALILMLSLASLGTSAATMAGSTDVDVWDGTTAAGFSSGSGLQNDPYIIKTGAELDLLASTCMGGEKYEDTYFRLEADIDWGGNIWTPIGYDTTNLFAGHFDGNGQTIYNLECFEVYAGIFGVIKGGSIKNLKVDYATFTTDTRYAGGICAWMKLATIEGVSAGEHVIVQGTDIMMNTAQMGGCFGLVHSSTVQGATFYGTLNCYSVTGSCFIGGIAGVVGGEATMKYCVNYGKVNNPNTPPVVDNVCYTGGVVGGIGASSKIGTVEFCVNHGEVNSIDVAGGVAGRIHVDNSVMRNCYNLGQVTGARAGTVLGYLSKLYVLESNCGVESAGVSKALGYEKPSEDPAYKAPGDSNIKVETENVITTISEYNEADGQTAVIVPIFNTVTPTEPAETTAPDTTEEQTTEAPDTTEKPEDSTKEETPESTKAPSTSAPENNDNETPSNTTAPEKEKGCGGVVSFAAILLCIIPVAVISKKH